MVQLCQQLGDVPKSMTMGELLEYTVDTVEVYQVCKQRHKALVDYLDKR